MCWSQRPSKKNAFKFMGEEIRIGYKGASYRYDIVRVLLDGSSRRAGYEGPFMNTRYSIRRPIISDSHGFHFRNRKEGPGYIVLKAYVIGSSLFANTYHCGKGINHSRVTMLFPLDETPTKAQLRALVMAWRKVQRRKA